MQGRIFGERAAMLAGLAARLLGWRPDEFWRATPAELAAVLQEEAIEPVAGDELERLMEQFPDG
ncbi:MAG TPA: phage tail assembly chaperone [Sphingomicrobium sp.]|nr:phage tail assembly chaperone [Sphingomicrobium sp.]